MRDWILVLAGEWFWRSWGDRLYSVRTGEPAFDQVFGVSNFDYWERHPEAGALHDAFFAAMSRTTTAPLVAAYDCSRFDTVVDAGGSTGPLLAAILAAHPGVRGILFDLPHVVAGAAPVLAEAGVAGRCAVVGGDFFEESLPAGGDAYVLRWILHDYDDERAIRILRACRAAMASDGRLLVVEQVIASSEGPAGWMSNFHDLQMLIPLGWAGTRRSGVP